MDISDILLITWYPGCMSRTRQATQQKARSTAADDGPVYGSTGEIPHHLLVDEITARREAALTALVALSQESFRLDVATRSLIAQARAEGQTWDAIAKALGQPQPTVYSRYAKSVGALLARSGVEADHP